MKRFRWVFLLLPYLLALTAAAEPVLTGKTKAECVPQIQAYLAAERRLPEGSWGNRAAAAAIAEKTRFDDAGKAVFSVKAMDRIFGVLPNYQAIGVVVTGRKLPEEYQALVMKQLCGLYLFPSRQSPQRIGVNAWKTKIAAIPGDAVLVTIGPGETLASHIEKAWPTFTKLNSLHKTLVYRYLAELNPLVTEVGAYVSDQGGAIVRGDAGIDLETTQLVQFLYECDPSMKLMDDAIVEPYKDQPQGEMVPLRLDAKTWRIARYRIPVGAEILIPVRALSDVVNPDTLDLRNLWLRDLSELKGQNPTALNLSGNAVRNLAVLKGMKKLKLLKLDANPVSDLSAIQGLPLERLQISRTDVTDLSPLSGGGLKHLELRETEVVSIDPLKGLGLEYLDLYDVPVPDLGPLLGMPLTYLRLDIAYDYKDFMMFEDIPTLQNINDVPMDQWFEDYTAFRTDSNAVGEDDCKDSKKPTAKKAPPKTPPKKPKKSAIPSLDDIGLDL